MAALRDGDAGIRPLTARLLVARGIAEADLAARFLAPRLADLRPPDGMADLQRALERLVAALSSGETIGVFGDYDVDGVTTAAVLTSALRALGGQVVARAASRHAGYGLGARRRRALRRRRLPRAGHRRLRHQRPRGAGARRARAASTRSSSITTSCPKARRAAYALVNSRRPDDALPVQGSGLVRRGVLPGGGAAHRGSASRLRSARPARPGGARNDRRPGAAGRGEPHPGRRRPRAAVAAEAARASRALARRAELDRRPHHGARRRLPADAAAQRRRPPGRGAAGARSAAGRRRRRRAPGGRARRPEHASGSASRSWSGRRRSRRRRRRSRRTPSPRRRRRRGLAPGRRRHHRGAPGRPVRAAGHRDRVPRRGRGGARRAPSPGVNLFEALAACARPPRPSSAATRAPPA